MHRKLLSFFGYSLTETDKHRSDNPTSTEVYYYLIVTDKTLKNFLLTKWDISYKITHFVSFTFINNRF